MTVKKKYNFIKYMLYIVIALFGKGLQIPQRRGLREAVPNNISLLMGASV